MRVPLHAATPLQQPLCTRAAAAPAAKRCPPAGPPGAAARARSVFQQAQQLLVPVQEQPACARGGQRPTEGVGHTKREQCSRHGRGAAGRARAPRFYLPPCFARPPPPAAARSLLVIELDKGAAVLWQQHAVALLDAGLDDLALLGAAAGAHGQHDALMDLGRGAVERGGKGRGERGRTARCT